MAFELFYAMLAGKHCRLQALRFVPSFSLDFFSDFCRQWRGWVHGALPAFNIISEIVKLRFLWSSDIRALWARLSGACNLLFVKSSHDARKQPSMVFKVLHRKCYYLIHLDVKCFCSRHILEITYSAGEEATPCTYFIRPYVFNLYVTKINLKLDRKSRFFDVSVARLLRSSKHFIALESNID